MRPNYYQIEWLVPVIEEAKFTGLASAMALAMNGPDFLTAKVKRYLRKEFCIERNEYSVLELPIDAKEIALIGYLRGRGFDVYAAKFLGQDMTDFKLERDHFIVYVHEKDNFKAVGKMKRLHL